MGGSRPPSSIKPVYMNVLAAESSLLPTGKHALIKEAAHFGLFKRKRFEFFNEILKFFKH